MDSLILIKSELYLIYKRKLLFYIFSFLFCTNILVTICYSRYNIVYPNENDVNHINSFNFLIHIMLENSIFTFNMIAIFLTIIVFDFKFFNIFYIKKFKLFDVFLSKIIIINCILLFLLLLFFVVNLLFGLFLFDIPKSIFVYGINHSLGFVGSFIYAAKFYFVSFCLFSLLSSLTIFFYTIFNNKILTFSMIFCFLFMQVYFPKFSIIIYQIELKKNIILDDYFYSVITYILLNIFIIFVSYYLFVLIRERKIFQYFYIKLLKKSS